ncbi:MAG TPA: bacillithiol system redox-active protein YtxJ [Balneolales bacterium]|nr:bacillithiol system redox-active protein YtxJ [Balneolales bacterium]
MRDYWVKTTDTDAIERIIHRSNRVPQFIYKHSTRCGVSSHTYRELSDVTDELIPDIEINYVDVIANRDVSNEIAERLDVEHQSPQLLLIQSNKVVWKASHYDIEADVIKEKAKEAIKALAV